ncbi:MAG: mycothiol synthase [Actinomycetota bacterium]
MTTSDERRSEVTIRVVDPATSAADRPSTGSLGADLQAVMDRALPPDQRDDRFHNWTTPDGLVLAIAEDGNGPMAFLGGGVDRGRLQLDGLLSSDRATASDGPMLALALYRALEPSFAAAAADTIELWGKPAAPWHRAIADHHGFDELRALHQMRCALPVDTPPVDSRAFVPGVDEAALLTVNNRAFADHPDQGGMTADDLAASAQQPWFNPDGIRLLEDPDRPDRLAGFCWTKIHEPLAPGQPRLGEIYAIGVDPDHHGKGLGKPLTAAGLAWLADQGITTGMLYVEADNTPAIRTYEKLGFTRHRTDRAWSKRLAGGSP